MSFQAYLDNIKAKTGKTPDDFHRAARGAGLLQPGTTATQIVAWLGKDYELGRGHAMAIFAVSPCCDFSGCAGICAGV